MSNDYKLIIIAALFVIFIFMVTYGQQEDYFSKAKSMYESFTGAPVQQESFVTLDQLIDSAVESESRIPTMVQPVIQEQADPVFAERRAEEEEFLKKKREQVKEIQLLPQELDASLNQLADRNFLISGLQIGVDSRGSSLRNANLQLRSEPPIKKEPVCIWNMSTYQPDLTRKKIDM